jgi:hypothetical protein
MLNWLKTMFSKPQSEKTKSNVFTVDTGNLPPEKAAEFFEKVKEEKVSKPKPKQRGRPKKKTD